MVVVGAEVDGLGLRRCEVLAGLASQTDARLWSSGTISGETGGVGAGHGHVLRRGDGGRGRG